MTPEELSQLLAGDSVNQTLDIKTLVMDIVRNMSDAEIQQIFYAKLPDLTSDYVKDYLFMRRS